MLQGVQNPALQQAISGQSVQRDQGQGQRQQVSYQSFQFEGRVDVVSFSSDAVSSDEAQEIALNRAFEKLRSVVSDARESLGIPEGQEVDTSPGATADRIADFGLNFFEQYAENNGLENNEEGRAQFAEFIGNAFNQGIEEARGILTSLSALNPDNESAIDEIGGLLQDRLDDFIANGLGSE